MGLGTWIASVWGTGQSPEELQAESDRLDALKQQQDAAYVARHQAAIDDEQQFGVDTAAEEAALARWQKQVAQDETGPTATFHQNVQDQLDRSYDEGMAEGSRNVTGFFSGIFDIFGKAGAALLKSIPWWLWLLALTVVGWFVFVETGGLAALLRRARK